MEEIVAINVEETIESTRNLLTEDFSVPPDLEQQRI